MTQRSAERWNTGKRGAAQRRMEINGKHWAKRNFDLPEVFLQEVIPEYVASLAFRCPELAKAFYRGVWEWVENQEVSI